MSFNAIDNNLSTNLVLVTKGAHYSYLGPHVCQAVNRRRRAQGLPLIRKPTTQRY